MVPAIFYELLSCCTQMHSSFTYHYHNTPPPQYIYPCCRKQFNLWMFSVFSRMKVQEQYCEQFIVIPTYHAVCFIGMGWIERIWTMIIECQAWCLSISNRNKKEGGDWVIVRFRISICIKCFDLFHIYIAKSNPFFIAAVEVAVSILWFFI